MHRLCKTMAAGNDAGAEPQASPSSSSSNNNSRCSPDFYLTPPRTKKEQLAFFKQALLVYLCVTAALLLVIGFCVTDEKSRNNTLALVGGIAGFVLVVYLYFMIKVACSVYRQRPPELSEESSANGGPISQSQSHYRASCIFMVSETVAAPTPPPRPLVLQTVTHGSVTSNSQNSLHTCSGVQAPSSR